MLNEEQIKRLLANSKKEIDLISKRKLPEDFILNINSHYITMEPLFNKARDVIQEVLEATLKTILYNHKL